MQEGKTIGQLMEEMRQKAGAQNYHGHDYMDLQRFAGMPGRITGNIFVRIWKILQNIW